MQTETASPAEVTVRRPPPAARVLPDRWFYGWYIAIGCSVVMFVGAGAGYYGLAVYLDPLQEEHGWSNSAVSGATGLYFALSGIAGALFGPYIDRHGPMRLMPLGFTLIAVGASMIGFVQQLWQLYAVYAVLALGFGMAAGVAVNAIMTRWFVRRRARAMSVSATGISLGGVVLTPLLAWLVEVGGLRVASLGFGIVVAAVALPVVYLVLAFDPRDLGLRPDGDLDEPPPDPRGALSEAAQRREWTMREVLHSVSFWGVLVAFVLVLMAQTGFVLHQISFLEDRLGSRSAAAFALSTTAFGSIVARLAVGFFADAVDKRWLTVALFAVQGTSVLLVLHVDSVWATYLLTLVFGFTIGNVYMMQSLLVGEIFGMVSFGTVFGLVALAGQTGSGLGPFAVGWLEDQTGGYTVPFTVTAVVTYVAAGAVVLARPVAANGGDQARAVRDEAPG